MTTTSTSLLAVLTGLALLGCSGTGASIDGSGSDEATAALTQDLQLGGDASYLRLRRDVRRCAAPLCGGFFVERVNRLSTICSDGERRAECYVADLDTSAIGLSPDQEGLIQSSPTTFVLRGEIVSQLSDFGDVGRLIVSEAWQGHAGVTPRGAFSRVKNEGIVCITSPCLSFSSELLNHRLPTVPVAEVDLEGISSDPSDAFEQLNEPDGLLVAARPTLVTGPAGRALGLDASEYYIPLLPNTQLCGTRGAPLCAEGSFCDFPPESICGRADGPGVCEPIPEFCIEIFAPVCGCDGQTYGNSCFANAAGVSVESEGECEPSEPPGQLCGSRGLPECPDDSFCSFPPEASCGRADVPGVCAVRPEACIQIFDPVCGCDGLTHGNACTAASAGVSVDFVGACEEASE
jgi:hypothetical protein